jgi:hypothetical protein
MSIIDGHPSLHGSAYWRCGLEKESNKVHTRSQWKNNKKCLGGHFPNKLPVSISQNPQGQILAKNGLVLRLSRNRGLLMGSPGSEAKETRRGVGKEVNCSGLKNTRQNATMDLLKIITVPH